MMRLRVAPNTIREVWRKSVNDIRVTSGDRHPGAVEHRVPRWRCRVCLIVVASVAAIHHCGFTA